VKNDPQLDLTNVEIRPLSDETVVKGFCCGKEPLNDFLKGSAHRAEQRCEMRVFCAHPTGSPSCIGFYALQVSTDTLQVPNKKWVFRKQVAPFPAVKLAWLAVHRNYQRQKLGRYLLMDACAKVAIISKFVGIYALTLDSLDEDSTKFYRSLGFEEYSKKLTPPKMLYPIQDVLALSQPGGEVEEQVAPSAI
jgi:ribosomal protein S18 acetylase RimI-like enzyme